MSNATYPETTPATSTGQPQAATSIGDGTPATLTRADTLSPLEKTQVLLEAMPWLHAYRGSIIVVKYGGNAMINDQLRQAFAQDIRFLYEVGLRPVVVHGGGPQINQMLERLDLQAPFVDGYRVTTPEVMEVVRMVLTGKVQREVVGLLNVQDSVAVGISGEDAGLFQAEKRASAPGKDLGLVGDIVAVNPEPVLNMLSRGHIPVISSVAPDAADPKTVLNVNADAAAAALAGALPAQKLVILTDVEGLYQDFADKDSLIQRISASALEQLVPGLSSGMIPKVRACLDAVKAGVEKATIIDGRVAHSMLLEIVTDAGNGTEVVPDHLLEPGERHLVHRASANLA